MKTNNKNKNKEICRLGDTVFYFPPCSSTIFPFKIESIAKYTTIQKRINLHNSTKFVTEKTIYTAKHRLNNAEIAKMNGKRNGVECQCIKEMAEIIMAFNYDGNDKSEEESGEKTIEMTLSFKPDEIGKNVFLTREEAENKLRAIKG